MIRYVLGFAFAHDPLGMLQVALIRKSHPDWQAGRLNGLGGKRQPGESPQAAMAREFLEEAGVEVPPARWRLRGIMEGDGFDNVPWTCDVLRADCTWDELRAANGHETLHDAGPEVVRIVEAARLHAVSALMNLRWLIPVLRDPDAPAFRACYGAGRPGFLLPPTLTEGG